ncbi:branched-chain amino acid ABC transporter permease [Roseateles sp.]|uniref:branched-chain amino acid ABC transporter permease n=1 Tax=Roseateles sp. TaxID=1971397 RepID=UPI00286D5DF2|nr:branched-chain amino acid ABC transporter permease [Roseateles sp.]
MRYVFKTRYEQDLRMFRDGVQASWYLFLVVVLLLAPLLLGNYLLSLLSFILIYSIVGIGLMLLIGFTGQMSIGHAAFFAVGAYTEAVLQGYGWPFIATAPCAIALAAVAGFVIGLPTLRLTGIYLAIATMSFGFIVEEVIARWESVTGGNAGKAVPSLKLIVGPLNGSVPMYLLCLVCVVSVGLVARNLLRSPSGRAFIAIRDSEVSAQSMGINLARYKTRAFAISAAMTGLAGALYAHQIKFLGPDQFTLLVSVEFLMMVVIGGMGSLRGAVFGAIFMIALPQLIGQAKAFLPAAVAEQTGLNAAAFGIITVLFVLFEPLGLNGRWIKIQTWFSLFPTYRKGMFKRKKSYTKSERLA